MPRFPLGAAIIGAFAVLKRQFVEPKIQMNSLGRSCFFSHSLPSDLELISNGVIIVFFLMSSTVELMFQDSAVLFIVINSEFGVLLVSS